MNTAAAVPHHKLPLTACESSQIYAIGHCPHSNTLVIQFKSKGGAGNKYSYPCPPEKFQKFLAAESKGRFFADHIKANTKDHPFTKLPADTEA